MTAKADRIRDLGALELPGEARREPILGELDLPSVLEHLTEDPVVVADAVPVRRDSERRHALHEAGGEPSEAAVAKPRVGLERAKMVEVHAQLRERGASGLDQAEVPERVEQQSADQELEREVVDALAALAVGASRRFHPVAGHLVARGECRRNEPVAVARMGDVLAHVVEEFVDDGRAEGGDGIVSDRDGEHPRSWRGAGRHEGKEGAVTCDFRA